MMMKNVGIIGHVGHGKVALTEMVDATKLKDRGITILDIDNIGAMMDAVEENKKDYFTITARPNYAELDTIGLPPTPKRLRGKEIFPARTEPKISRNSPCLCGSGRKSKRCCNP